MIIKMLVSVFLLLKEWNGYKSASKVSGKHKEMVGKMREVI